MRTLRCSTVLLAGAALIASTGCSFGYYDPAVWIDDERALSVPAAGAVELHVATHNGFVTATGTGGDDVDVVAFVRAGGSDDEDAAACLAAVDVVAERDGDAIGVSWRWAENRRSTWRAIVSLRVTQPDGLPVRAATHNGELRAENVTSEVKLTTHNGDVWVRDCMGQVVVGTHNGNIRVDGFGGLVEAGTHNGNVELALGGKVQGRVRTHNGSVAIVVADSARTRIVCETHNGRMAADASFGRVTTGKKFLVADFGGDAASGAELAVRTHNGSVRLQATGRD